MVGLRRLGCAIAACVCAGWGNAGAATQKHLKISTADHVIVEMAAASIETDSAPSSAAGQSAVIVHLKGSAEIRMRWTDGSAERVVMHADAADFHEDTGEVEAHGNVSMTPVKVAEAEDKSSN